VVEQEVLLPAAAVVAPLAQAAAAGYWRSLEPLALPVQPSEPFETAA
jgi:hypothetical protein